MFSGGRMWPAGRSLRTPDQMGNLQCTGLRGQGPGSSQGSANCLNVLGCGFSLELPQLVNVGVGSFPL